MRYTLNWNFMHFPSRDRFVRETPMLTHTHVRRWTALDQYRVLIDPTTPTYKLQTDMQPIYLSEICIDSPKTLWVSNLLCRYYVSHTRPAYLSKPCPDHCFVPDHVFCKKRKKKIKKKKSPTLLLVLRPDTHRIHQLKTTDTLTNCPGRPNMSDGWSVRIPTLRRFPTVNLCEKI